MGGETSVNMFSLHQYCIMKFNLGTKIFVINIVHVPSSCRGTAALSEGGGRRCPQRALLLLSHSSCHRCQRSVLQDWIELNWLNTIQTSFWLLRLMFIFSSVLAQDVLKGIEELIPSFRGVKFSGTDLMDLGRCVSYSHSDWSVLYGVDEVSFFTPSVISQSFKRRPQRVESLMAIQKLWNFSIMKLW